MVSIEGEIQDTVISLIFLSTTHNHTALLLQDEYKRLYAKYSANRPKKGPSAAVQAAFAKSGLAPPGIAEVRDFAIPKSQSATFLPTLTDCSCPQAGGAYSTFEDLSRNGNSVAPPVPGLEDADPHADVPAGKLPAMSADDHAKLDEYKICGRCQVPPLPRPTSRALCWQAGRPSIVHANVPGLRRHRSRGFGRVWVGSGGKKKG